MKSFMYRNKGIKFKNKIFRISKILIVILIASFMFIKSENIYAYFLSVVSYKSEEIIFADYNIEVSVDNKVLNDNTYEFEKNETKQFTLLASGTSTTGYCKISISGTNYYTTQIVPENEIYITIEGVKGDIVNFISHWGNSEKYESGSNLIDKENGIIYYSSKDENIEVNSQRDKIIEGASSIVEEDGIIRIENSEEIPNEDIELQENINDDYQEESDYTIVEENKEENKIESENKEENKEEIESENKEEIESEDIGENIEWVESEETKEDINSEENYKDLTEDYQVIETIE